jgi:hypothetical protein
MFSSSILISVLNFSNALYTGSLGVRGYPIP